MAVTQNETGLYEASIDGKTYEFQKWGAEKSLDTLMDIMQFVGKPLTIFANAAMSVDGVKAEITPDLLAMVIDSLLGGMGVNKKTIMAIIKRVTTEKVTCDRRSIVFDTHFSDGLDHLFKVVKAGLDVQYGNFLHTVLDEVGMRAKKQPVLPA